MAERGAHLVESIGGSKHRVSFFDIVASETLNRSLYAALKRVVHHIYQNNETHWILKFYDEWYLCLNGLVQVYYLKNYGGSLSETFYGLTRKNNETGEFNKKDYALSLLSFTAIPYLLKKLDQKWNDSIDTQSSREKLFVKIYGSGRGLYQLIKLIMFLRYLTKNSTSCLPNHYVSNIRLEYAPRINTSWNDIFRKDVKLSKVASDMFFRCLEFLAFFLQFVQWFQNEERSKHVYNLPCPEPPNIEPDIATDQKCPLCLQNFSYPTLITLSGYVYCHKCLFNYIEKKGYQCPITSYSITINDLVHLYEN